MDKTMSILCLCAFLIAGIYAGPVDLDAVPTGDGLNGTIAEGKSPVEEATSALQEASVASDSGNATAVDDKFIPWPIGLPVLLLEIPRPTPAPRPVKPVQHPIIYVPPPGQNNVHVSTLGQSVSVVQAGGCTGC